MELFYAADAVVGPHGAGFAHLAFCNPKTPFLEFFSPAYTCPCYWFLCHHMEHPYYYLFGEGEHLPDGIHSGSDPDILIDPNKLTTLLKRICN